MWVVRVARQRGRTGALDEHAQVGDLAADLARLLRSLQQEYLDDEGAVNAEGDDLLDVARA